MRNIAISHSNEFGNMQPGVTLSHFPSSSRIIIVVASFIVLKNIA